MNGRGLRVGLCAVLALSMVAAAAAQDDASRFVGRWESEVRSPTGIGTSLQLRDDGSVSITSSAMADSTYRLRGDRLVMSFVDPFSGEESQIKLDVKIAGDVMDQSDPETGEQTHLERIPSPLSDELPMVGIWSFSHSSNRQAFQIYTTDGRMHLRVPISTNRGTWVVDGDQMTMTVDGQSPSVLRVELDDDRMSLRSSDGTVQRYDRVAW